MAISASTDRPSSNVSRSITINAIFIFATLVVGLVAVAANFVLLSKPWLAAVRNPYTASLTWMAEQQPLFSFSWVLTALMLTGIIGSVVTLIWVLANRLSESGKYDAAPARVCNLGILMLIAPFVAGMLTLFMQLVVAIRMFEMVRDFDIQLPGPSMLYISFVNFMTNPVNVAILVGLLSPLAVLFLLKEFLLKDKVINYLLNAFAALCWLVVIIFGCISVLLPFTAIINKLSE